MPAVCTMGRESRSMEVLVFPGSDGSFANVRIPAAGSVLLIRLLRLAWRSKVKEWDADGMVGAMAGPS